MRSTLSEAKALDSGITSATGVVSCSPKFVELLNQAQRRLMMLGTWWGTYRRLWVCASSGCIVWPREVAAPLGIRIANTGVRIRNEWFEFGDAVSQETCSDTCSGSNIAFDRSNVTGYRPSPYTSWKVRVYPSVAADAGAKVVLQGTDTNGQRIRSEHTSGYAWGEELTIESPFSTSTFTFTGEYLTGAQKPVTKGYLNVYAVNPDTGDEYQIAAWEPSERNPSYRRSYVGMLADASCGCSAENGCDPVPTCSGSIFEAMVRMQFIPALVDSDWLAISDFGAIAAAMKAIKAEDARDYQAAGVEWGIAKGILRSQLDSFDPPQRVTINTNPHGTARPVRIFGGMR